MLHIFPRYDHPSSITASLLISPSWMHGLSFCQESTKAHSIPWLPPLHSSTVTDPRIAICFPDSLRAKRTCHHWRHSGSEISGKVMSLCKAMLLLHWEEWKASGCSHAHLVAGMGLCLVWLWHRAPFSEDLRLTGRIRLMSQKREVITNKMRWFFSCESVDSTSYRPACRRQWHM